MQKKRANQASQAQRDEQDDDSGRRRPDSTSIPPVDPRTDGGPAARYEHLAAELDDLADVPTAVLAEWVAARGRCLWETTFGDPPDWFADADPDRELATRLCAGCPVRSECLEFELRIAGDQTVGVWGGLHAEDRRALLTVWRARRRDELTALPDDEGWWRR